MTMLNPAKRDEPTCQGKAKLGLCELASRHVLSYNGDYLSDRLDLASEGG